MFFEKASEFLYCCPEGEILDQDRVVPPLLRLERLQINTVGNKVFLGFLN